MLFGWVTRCGPRNNVLDEGPDPPRLMGDFCAVRLIEKHCESLLRCMQQKVNNGISATAAADCITSSMNNPLDS